MAAQCSLGARRNGELLADACDMVLDGKAAKDQHAGDSGVAGSSNQEG
jgi:hypothetical protein